MTAYQTLETRFRRIQALGDAQGLLHWDMSTMMPPGGAQARGEQLAVMATLGHELMTANETRDALDGAEANIADLSDWQRANLAEMKRQWVHANALSADLVEALSKAGTTCEAAWRKARPEADFAAVLPTLKVVLDLTRQSAQAKSEHLDCSLYDALLDEYEPGGKSDEVERLFADLGDFLPGFIQEALDHQAARPAPIAPTGPFPVAKQRALAERLMAQLGFDFEFGRLDESLHPFCGGVPDDVRITTRYDESDFSSALMGVLHETGHALYDRGLPTKWRGQPVGNASGMSVHESQSLLIEMQVCRSNRFINFAAPLMRDAFGANASDPAWTSDNLHARAIRVERSFIRVDADEATYPAHVILRYRLEKALIEGRMEAKHIPEAWNESMRELLGVTPPTDREGCLQDIHWFDGAWGYFPTYTMGALAAAQIYQAAVTADETIPGEIEQGNFKPLFNWLRPNLHQLGSLHSPAELVETATGKPLGTDAFKAHLQRRYLGGDDR